MTSAAACLPRLSPPAPPRLQARPTAARPAAEHCCARRPPRFRRAPPRPRACCPRPRNPARRDVRTNRCTRAPVWAADAAAGVDQVQLPMRAAGVGGRQRAHDRHGIGAALHRVQCGGRIQRIDECLCRQRTDGAARMRAQRTDGEEAAGDGHAERTDASRAMIDQVTCPLEPVGLHSTMMHCRAKCASGTRPDQDFARRSATRVSWTCPRRIDSDSWRHPKRRRRHGKEERQ